MSKQNIVKEITRNSLTLTALGGLHETGKNMWVLESKRVGKDIDYLILDAGVHYPGNEAPGVDYTLADYQYLINKSKQIKALVLSSAHEYNSGGAHHVINKCDIKKVIGSKLALAQCKQKLAQAMVDKIEWEEFKSREVIQVDSFKVIPFRVTASSSESYAVAVESGDSKFFYSGTYKIDQTPTDGLKTDVVGITQYSSACVAAGKDIDLMISDSTNVEIEGYSKSELELVRTLKKLIASKKARVVINTCNSNTIRIQNLFNIAQQLGKKVALLNKECRETCSAAKAAGCLNYDESVLISIKDVDNYPDDQLLIISTAPEGEALQELEKIAYDRSLEFQIKKGDVVINSADLPPGTVRVMAQISDQLFLKEAEIIGGKNANVHVESHALTEEMKLLFNLVRPQYFIPGLGETRLLVRHAKLAVDTGFDPGAIYILDNGDQIDINANGVEVLGHIQTGEILFNNSQDFHVDTKIIKERESLAIEGIVTVSFSLNKKNKVIAGPVFSAKACTFSNNKEWRVFCLMNSQDIIDAVETLSEDNPRASIEDFQNVVREHMNRIIKTQIGKKPSVIVLATQI
jgi:ribonuclease J